MSVTPTPLWIAAPEASAIRRSSRCSFAGWTPLDDHRLDADMLMQQRHFPLHRLQDFRPHRPGETPRRLEIAIELLGLNEVIEFLARDDALGIEGLRLFHPVFLDQAGKGMPDIAAGDAAIAAGRAIARAVAFQHHDIAAGARQRDRRPHTGVSAADDNDIGSLRQVAVFGGLRFGFFPPIGHVGTGAHIGPLGIGAGSGRMGRAMQNACRMPRSLRRVSDARNARSVMAT